MSRQSPILVPLITIIFGLTGCSGIHTKTPEGKAVVMDQQGFADYVERVFRHHNSVVDQLIYSSESHDDRTSPLAQAEAKMTFACLPLNEVVSASVIGQTSGYWTRMHLPEAVPNCEAETRNVEELISADH